MNGKVLLLKFVLITGVLSATGCSNVGMPGRGNGVALSRRGTFKRVWADRRFRQGREYSIVE